ncbi:MAG TPA: glycosyltransferase [Gemmatales bacterium]|nr:glycosyltransferase [Gemmatales bacterium]
MLHLVHVLTSLEYGGVESFAIRLLTRLPADQFRSCIVMTTPEQGQRYDAFVSQVQLPVIQCHYVHKQRMQFTRDLSKQFKSLKPDVVMSYAFGNHAMVAVASWLAGVPRNYVRVAGDPNRQYTKSWRLTQMARPFCTGEIAVSQCTAQALHERMSLPLERIHTIVNGCEVEDIFARAETERRKRTPSERLRLLMVSRMDDAKDHTTLLQAMARLQAQGMQLDLTLAGEGPERSNYQNIVQQLGIAEHVHFLGNCTTVDEEMGKADVLVHSTRTEGMPNVLLEAMAARLPIIASDIPPCREVLDQGRAGLLFERENVESLVAAIQQLAQDVALRQQYVTAGAERVMSQYHVDRMARQYQHLFQHGTVS